MKEKPSDLHYGLDDHPPFPRLLLLALQQIGVMAIYLVIVQIVASAAKASPQDTQNYISLSMIALAIGTLVQAIWKGPVGSGFLAPPVVSAIYVQASVVAAQLGGMPLVATCAMIAGALECALAHFFRYLKAFFPAPLIGLIIVSVGLELGLLGTEQFLDVSQGASAPLFPSHILNGFITLAIMFALAIWGKGMLRLFSAIAGLLVGWISAYFLGLIPQETMATIIDDPLFGWPRFGLISYSFNGEIVVPFLISGLAAMIRTAGVMITCQRMNDAKWKKPDYSSIQGGIFADGVGCIAAGLCGSPGISTSPSSVGISKASGATSRIIALPLAAFLILFSCMPKIAALFLSIPISVIGAAMIFTGSIMIVTGIETLASRPLDIRKICLVGVSLLFGLSHRIFPAYFAALPEWVQPFTSNILTITTITALILNTVFRIGIQKTISTDIHMDPNSPVQLSNHLLSQGKGWAIPSDDLQRIVNMTKNILGYIQEGHLAEGAIHTKVSFDEIHFIVTIDYQGELIRLPQERSVNQEHMLDEMPMIRGLSALITDFYPSQVECNANGKSCHLRLVFEV